MPLSERRSWVYIATLLQYSNLCLARLQYIFAYLSLLRPVFTAQYRRDKADIPIYVHYPFTCHYDYDVTCI